MKKIFFAVALAFVICSIGLVVFSNYITTVELRAENRAMAKLLAQQSVLPVVDVQPEIVVDVPDSNGQRALLGATEAFAAETPEVVETKEAEVVKAEVAPEEKPESEVVKATEEAPAATAVVTSEDVTPVPLAEQVVSVDVAPAQVEQVVVSADAVLAPTVVPTAIGVEGDVFPSLSIAPEAPEDVLSFELPTFGELPAVERNGKVILPAVTPVFTSNMPKGKLLNSGIIDYDPNERGNLFEQIVRKNQVKGDVLETRIQGYGKPRRGDKSFLFNTGKVFFGQTDTNGHYEGSPTNGVAFNTPRRVIGGYGVFVTGYKMAKMENGKKRRCALNIVYVFRDGGVVLRNPDVWNVREFFVAGNEGFIGMSDEDIYLNEAEAFAGENNDRSYFGLIVVPQGGVVDPVADRDRLIKENGFHSFSEGLLPDLKL